MQLILIRHAETGWNVDGRLQGRQDPPLTLKGRGEAARWRLPTGLTPVKWFTSPLRRTRETALQMGINAEIEPVLTEMDWGQWEGLTLDGLRNRYGTAFRENEDRGLDFRPPGGESPRMVQTRMLPWLLSLGESGANVGAITHKGVIRAIIALAARWDMMGVPPTQVASGTAQAVRIARSGGLTLEATDIDLSPDEVFDGRAC